MATVQFKIRPTKNKDKECNIYFRLSYGAYEIISGKKVYKPLDYYISESIIPKYWNKGEASRSFVGYKELNSRLENIRTKVLDIVRRLENDGICLNNNTIKSELDILFSRERSNTSKTIDFNSFIESFIEHSNVSNSTKKSYLVTFANLKEYQSLNKLKLNFDNINIDFYNRFVSFLQSKNYAKNTIGTRIKVIKTFMNKSFDLGYHTNTEHQREAFKKLKEETDAIYLNEFEISKIRALDLPGDKLSAFVRDWFVIGCYTGLRYSDLKSLTWANVEDSIIKIKMHKTNTFVEIPLHPIVKDIFEHYNFELPKLISNQRFNDAIKYVCKLAKIDDIITIYESKGNLKTQKKAPKHDLVTAHTARRSYATNAYYSGVPTIQLMKTTGHKSESTLLKYIRANNKENAKRLQLHPFFNMAIK